MIGTVDSTVSLAHVIDMLNHFPPPIISEELPPNNRISARTQSIGGYLHLSPEIDAYQLQEGSSSSSLLPRRFGEPQELRGTVDLGEVEALVVPAASKRDPWLDLTAQAIAAHRNLEAGWDNGLADTPSNEALDVAELLAQGFSTLPMSLRPQFLVDTEGAPSFTIYNDELYLHLTIDGPNSISWFRSVGGDEQFEDGTVVTAENAHQLAQRILSV
ncbi:hypothetical protein [Sinorhizobium meliloti]|uniref:Uncharacterized protein n=1 Tax=Rhizobium meliloti TaxID=382 RepID=A0A2J0Z0E4_RHIML|nr:hypothetical protein [Sinorhizobium meliloti]PJR13986.1 hypothetical protein CEJ86_19800 [Sinorhizobium meliloti]